MDEGRNAINILAVKPTEKRPLGSPWCRWKDIIRIYLKEIGFSTRNLLDSLRIGIIEKPL